MRIAICAVNSAVGYSGGRYLTWMMAEALASCGHEIVVWTNNVPAFSGDFVGFPQHHAIMVERRVSFESPPNGPFDIVIVVPHLGEPCSFFPKVLLLARRWVARVILLNFESPNWFNALAPEARDVALWDPWVQVSRVSDMVLSLAFEGNRYAELFYRPAGSPAFYRFAYPGINSLVADGEPCGGRDRQIICITRFGWSSLHKGASDLLDAISPAMRGYTLALVVGNGIIPPANELTLREHCRENGVALRLLYQLSDQEKFAEIRRSSLMLFLSSFEGFGYPPVEAIYCGTPCIVYDLPVLREVSGEALAYVPRGDVVALQEMTRRVLAGEWRPDADAVARVTEAARFESYAAKLDSLLHEVLSLPNPSAIANAGISDVMRWRWDSMSDRLRGVRLVASRLRRMANVVRGAGRRAT